MNFIKFDSLKSWSAYLSSLPADHQTFSEDTNIQGNGHLGQFDGIKEPKPEKITKFSITLFPEDLHLSNSRERSIKSYFCAEMAVSEG